MKEYLREIIGEKLGIEKCAVGSDAAFFSLGVTSIISEEILAILRQEYKNLSSTLLFEYPNINRLSNFLATQERQSIVKKLDERKIEPEAVDENVAGVEAYLTQNDIKNPDDRIVNKSDKAQKVAKVLKADDSAKKRGYDIAIIGISGKFPKAGDQLEYWRNLVGNRDCVEEIPEDRWRYDTVYSEEKNKENKSYSKWGGFIDDVDKFDPLFFSISPLEAELMDLQQKLFLTCCWEAMEDAGYGKTRYRKTNNIGVYAGVTWNEFSLIAHEEGYLKGQHKGPGSLYWSIPNRVSYFLNLTGPSLAIDTACSSSLVAIHQACQSILSGDCEMALAGGVNLSLHPSKYIYLSQSHFLSTDGKCRSFGEGGNGYVPGEGLGVILLKPLDKAVEDGDYVYGLIRGSATNHGGKTTGYTVPNPESHRNLILTAIDRAQIHPEELSYIECHGTGTALGDPIEIRGLTMAFQEHTNKKHFCGIGSVKSNIGHLEAAAGVAGLIKVLLSMRYGTLPASIHSKELNSKIDFDNSPFYVIRNNQKWAAEGANCRLAAVSSFGAGGSNAHVILESYDNSHRLCQINCRTDHEIITLSAQTQEQLLDYAKKLNIYIAEVQGYSSLTEQYSLHNIARTLQAGRECFRYRMAIIAASITELQKNLQNFISGIIDNKNVFLGEASESGKSENNSEKIPLIINSLKAEEIASLWVKGGLDNNLMEADEEFLKLPLPTYPFLKEKSWLTDSEVLYEKEMLQSIEYLHPLLDSNISTCEKGCFKKVFSKKEYFLKDHLVNNRYVLPGVCHLEMAGVGATLWGKGKVRNIKDVWFVSPITVGDELENVELELSSKEDCIHFEIKKPPEKGGSLFSQGTIDCREGFLTSKETYSADLAKLKAGLNKTLTIPEFYQLFAKIGITQKASFQVIREFFFKENEAFSKIKLPSDLERDFSDYLLHPALMDGVVQTAMAHILTSESTPSLIVPFHFEEIEIVKPLTSTIFVHAVLENPAVNQYKIKIFNDQGELSIDIKQFIVKSVKENKNFTDSSTVLREQILQANNCNLLVPAWDVVPVVKNSTVFPQDDNVVVVGGTAENLKAIRQYYSNVQSLKILSNDTIGVILNKLESLGNIRHIIWVAPFKPLKSIADDMVVKDQKRGVVQIFRMVKALLQSGYGTKDLLWTVITTQSQPISGSDAVNPTHASIHGLIGSMTKEYSNWKVRLVDLEAECEWPLAEILSIIPSPSGDAWVYRGGEWHRQHLVPFRNTPVDRSLYRSGGVYVVIGGAGGIGEAWSEYMIRTYQAHIIWIGRSRKDAAIQNKINRLAALGPAPYYVSADATDLKALQQAYMEIKQLYTEINGVIHSAIVLLDQSLARMDEERFQAALSAKVDVSVRIAQVFDNEALDFILFFSSMMSFTKDPGQCNYASGCTFKDAFAFRLAKELACPVKVINWGYWGSVGVVASSDYQKRMAQAGIGSIEPAEAMEALEILLAEPVRQLGLLKTTKTAKLEETSPRPLIEESITAYPEYMPSNAEDLQRMILINTDLYKPEEIDKSDTVLQTSLMEKLLCKLLWSQLKSAGLFKERDNSLADLKTKGKIPDLYDRWLAESIDVLAGNNYLTVDGSLCTVTDIGTEDLETAWKEWNKQKALWMKNPDLKARAVLVETTLLALPEVLTGKLPATDVMFPNSSIELVEGVYKNNLIADYYNEVVADTVVAYLEQRIKEDPKAGIRILEVGAGTGGTSTMVFRKLKPYQEHVHEYCYTDISKAFLIHAEEQFGQENPYLTCEIFNAAKPLSVQSIKPGGYDVVIATNVLHATPNIRETLRNVKAVLRKNGLLYLNEINSNSLFSHLTFGLLEGWWLYEDPGLRIPGCPGLYPEVWEKILDREGFRAIFFPAQKAHGLGQQIIIAESDGVVRQKQSEDSGAGIGKKTVYASLTQGPAAEPELPAAFSVRIAPDLLREKSTNYIKQMVSETLKIPYQRIEPSVSLEKYGIDSILVVRLTNKLREVFENISSTLFFEYQTIDALVEYFLNSHKESLLKLVGIRNDSAHEEIPVNERMLQEARPTAAVELLREKATIYIKQLVSDTLKIPFQRIDSSASLEKYGIDSILVVRLTNKLREAFENISSTLFFEYQTIDALVGYFLNNQKESLSKLVGIDEQPVVEVLPDNKLKPTEAIPVAAPELLREKATTYIKQLVSDTLKIPFQRIDSSVSLERYGIDSILVVRLTNKLREVFENISSTLFFEYQTIDALVGYFLNNQKESLSKLIGIVEQPRQEEVAVTKELTGALPEKAPVVPAQSSPVRDMESELRDYHVHDVAIIGLAGRYPGANRMEEFWNNLIQGKISVTEISKERWDWKKYYDKEKGKWGSIYSKWGAFVNDSDKFDPFFFQISPAEADRMDPQERLFLEIAYASIEDAGYTPANLSDSRKIGVFVGVMHGDYPTVPSYWSIANRVSYLFNFQGPSMAVDSACSSSLTAVHLALESLYSGISDCVIAGGVALINDPSHFERLSAFSMLSAGDKCKPFGDQADGIIAAEGMGAIVLKPLSKAVADGDHIYGIIKGSMINAGGKTNGYMVPNPNAQFRLIADCYKRAGISARAVSYVEAHGTGTALGDPIEITGLTRAFEVDTNEKQFCAIGSVKSNIGHSESTSGIAGITKVLLQLKHGQIVPSLNSKVLNPHIDFSSSPFVVQQELREWERPKVSLNGNTLEYPRIAGISSFGAGGANAHVVIQEYIPDNIADPQIRIVSENPAVILLSARNEERLRERVKQLLNAVKEQNFSDSNMADIAYTLQVGREAMDERLALLAASIKELEEKLQNYLDGHEGIIDLYRGHVKGNRDFLNVFASDEDMAKTIGIWLDKRKYGKLLNLWVKGIAIDWHRLYDGKKPFRISLPTYPFAKERYWVPKNKIMLNGGSAGTASETASVIHPLVQQNTSVFSEQRFSSVFTGQEFFLADHVVKGRHILPGVAYLEMAREAISYASALKKDQTGLQLKNILWNQPIVVNNDSVQVHIGLYPAENGEIAFEIYTETEEDGSEPVLHCQGRAVLKAGLESRNLNIPALQSECVRNTIMASQCYGTYRSMGITFGPGHQGIEKIHVGTGQVLAKLSLPSSVENTKDEFVLHPSLMDSAMQASIGLLMSETEPCENSTATKPFLPFTVKEVEILSGCTSNMWAYLRLSEEFSAGDKVLILDIDICDDSGNICVRIKGLATRVLENEIEPVEPSQAFGTLLLRTYWKEQSVIQKATVPDYDKNLVVVCEPINVSKEAIESGVKEARCISLPMGQNETEERFLKLALRIFEEIQGITADNPDHKVLVQIMVADKNEHQLFAGLSGMLKTAHLENSNLHGQIIEVSPDENLERVIEILKENRSCPGDNRIRYQEGKRFVTGWKEVEISEQTGAIPWKDQGVYLITGGAGGLGLIFAQEIAQRVNNPKLILTGRSVLDKGRQARIKQLEESGAQVIYKVVDVTQKKAVTDLIQNIEREFGRLNGIVHSAGIIRDNYIPKKNKEEFVQVLAPKVYGTVYLDQASKNMSLDCFILFSSIAGSQGNPGQIDYSTANSFMDIYAGYRNKLVQSKQRQGKTISINWPLWKDGGMQVDSEVQEMMRLNIGMTAMETSKGIRAFYHSLASGEGQVMVIEGDLARMKEKFLAEPAVTRPQVIETNTAFSSSEGIDTGSLLDKVQVSLKQIVSQILRINSNDIDVCTELSEYGFESLSLIRFNNKLNQEYKLELSPTIFFNHPTLQSLAEYLVKEYQAVFADKFPVTSRVEAPKPKVIDEKAKEVYEKISFKKRDKFRFAPVAAYPVSKPESSVPEAVAIIGVSGRFPMAGDINVFWQNLVEGRDCISEIPKERWDWRKYYGDPENEANKTNIKWGGFIEGVEEFDPLFFGISPREAEVMDPQQRLLMTYVWKAIEDAGYSANSLSGSNTAIFVGTMASGYGELLSKANIAIEGYSSTGIVASVGPNRMSYLLNIHGPSEPVETACSSSLIAIHRAVNAIADGNCEMAIAGGVNTILTPELHISFSKAGMLSEDGRCKTFSDKADGYVRGEGVGMIILKKLKAAERDGDHIYGVIRSTAENHGGRANSLTAPNPNAQAELLKTAYMKAGIDPRTVSYIEAHGTGTELGDPIEINGLQMAFKDMYQQTGEAHVTAAHCGIGSVKTNIGHLELAAGIAGIIKVILQIKHKTLVKSLHCDEINPYIQLKDSPFYIVRETKRWEAMKDTDGKDLPRRAGVSSFGFGGVNAHIVIEEYLPQNRETSEIVIDPQNPAIIVLSAKNKERLLEQAMQLLTAIREQQISGSRLADLAYTLQVGREAMEERLAVIAGSLKELEEKLEKFAAGQENIEDLYIGQVKGNKETLAIFARDEEMQEALEKWIQRKKYSKLVELWVKGLVFDWNKLYGDAKPRRISLPTYPFARERYWVPEGRTESGSIMPKSVMAAHIHPLMHENTSDLSEQRFSSSFTGQEFFLADHVVNGRRIMPGVACLEMARAAVERAAVPFAEGHTGIRLKNVVWTRPIVAGDQPLKVHIGLTAELNGEISYEIYSKSEDNGRETVTYSQGTAVLDVVSEAPAINILALQAELSQNILAPDKFYQAFKIMGIDYGPAYQGIERVYSGPGQVLAKLFLPASVMATVDQFILHPSLMDSAIQASIGLKIDAGGFVAHKQSLAFALSELEIYGSCTSSMWALIRYSSGSAAGDKVEKIDVELCDHEGVVCVRMKGFASREMDGDIQHGSISRGVSTTDSVAPLVGNVTLIPVWNVVPIEKGPQSPRIGDKVVLIGGTEGQKSKIGQIYPQSQILSISKDDDINAIVKLLEACGAIQHIICIAPYQQPLTSLADETVIKEQDSGLLLVFRVIKALLSLGYGDKELGWSVMTNQALPVHKKDMVNPTHAGIHGLMGSMAKEYPNWQVRVIDLELGCENLPAEVFTLPPDLQGDAWAYRQQEWYRQNILTVRFSGPAETLYRQGGVYVVIGGAGGIGEIWSEYMISTYQAYIIWIGRRPKDEDIQRKLDRLAALGPVPHYISADAADLSSMEQAYREIKKKHSGINGVIHSAVGVLDQSLANMEEGLFRAGLEAKIDISVRIAQVFKEEPLDFALFFSSIGAFGKALGQSSYAAGCTFEDAFAHQLKYEWPYAVKVMNWGYWGNVGIGSAVPAAFKNRLNHTGIGFIESPAAMQALENLLAGPVDQIALMKITGPQALQGTDMGELITVYPQSLPADKQSLQKDIREGLERIANYGGVR